MCVNAFGHPCGMSVRRQAAALLGFSPWRMRPIRASWVRRSSHAARIQYHPSVSSSCGGSAHLDSLRKRHSRPTLEKRHNRPTLEHRQVAEPPAWHSCLHAARRAPDTVQRQARAGCGRTVAAEAVPVLSPPPPSAAPGGRCTEATMSTMAAEATSSCCSTALSSGLWPRLNSRSYLQLQVRLPIT